MCKNEVFTIENISKFDFKNILFKLVMIGISKEDGETV